MKMAHTMIRVRDLDRSIGFYTDFLGLTETRRKDLGDAVLVFLSDEDEHHYVELTYNKDGREYDIGDQFGPPGILHRRPGSRHRAGREGRMGVSRQSSGDGLEVHLCKGPGRLRHRDPAVRPKLAGRALSGRSTNTPARPAAESSSCSCATTPLPLAPPGDSDEVVKLLSLPAVKSSATRDMAMRAAKKRDTAQGKEQLHTQLEYERNHD